MSQAVSLKRVGENPIDRYEDFVAQAIEGKYEGLTGADIRHAVREALVLCGDAATASDLFALSRRIESALDDIANQVIVLRAIERHSDAPSLRAAPLITLHKLAYGAEISETVRTSDTVADFPGAIPTGLAETDARFAELQGLVIDLAAMPPPPTAVAAHLLAHVFAAVIRIHYFADGNGRMARFAVQYLSVSWGVGFFSLPKVRNDAGWKSALKRAISGEIGDLSREIAKRLSE